MKIKIVNDDQVRVFLGDQELPGVMYVAFTADRDEATALLQLRGVEVMLETDNQLVDIETTPLDPL